MWSAAAGAAGVETLTPATYKIVLVAGDDSLPVFDNAVSSLDTHLQAWAGATAIQRLSASRPIAKQHKARLATLGHVLAAIAHMKPDRGQGCLVFATSHGGAHEGLWLAAGEAFLSPGALDAALLTGCGDAPTIVVVSSCFSGSFAQAPMTRANRIVLTAARADRTSFGCGAGRTYTVYDECFLRAFTPGRSWRLLYGDVAACVRAEEQLQHADPSEPQAWFGRNAAGMTPR